MFIHSVGGKSGMQRFQKQVFLSIAHFTFSWLCVQKPKDRPLTPLENQVTGIVYKVKHVLLYVHWRCKRSWKVQGAQHKPGIRGNNDPVIQQHAEKTGHNIYPSYVELLERGVNNRQIKTLVFGIFRFYSTTTRQRCGGKS